MQNQYTFIDLFSGIGGFRIGMEQAGFECLFSNDHDKYSNQTYKHWFGDGNHYEGSLWDKEVIDLVPQHDILCGGFPCQPFSSAGKKLGFNDDNQGNLFFRIEDIIESKRPKVVFLENVRNLLTHDNRNTWKTIIEIMCKHDYSLPAFEVINSKHWTPQSRHRIFMLFFRNDIDGESKSFEASRLLRNLAESRENLLPKFSSIRERNPDELYQIPAGTWSSLQRHKKAHQNKGNGFGYGLITDDETQTRTLSARYPKDGAEILIQEEGWERPRKITIKEGQALMGFTPEYAEKYGFDDGFPMPVSNHQAYKQLGNAVVPGVVEDIAMIIKNILD